MVLVAFPQTSPKPETKAGNSWWSPKVLGVFEDLQIVTGWWFQIFFIFIPIWGRFPF